MLPELSAADRAAVYGIALRHCARGVIRDGAIPGCRRRNQAPRKRAPIRADPTRVLDRLTTLHLVERVQPATSPGYSRRRIYRMADNFLDFYFFYFGVLGRYQSGIEAGLGPSVPPVLIESLDDHQGPRWEAAFRDHVSRLAAEGRLVDQIVAVGPFGTADGQNQIDVVAMAGRSRTPALAWEAKWTRQVSAPRIVADLLGKSDALPDRPEQLQIAVYGREQIVDPTANLLTITAEDILRMITQPDNSSQEPRM